MRTHFFKTWKDEGGEIVCRPRKNLWICTPAILPSRVMRRNHIGINIRFKDNDRQVLGATYHPGCQGTRNRFMTSALLARTYQLRRSNFNRENGLIKSCLSTNASTSRSYVYHATSPAYKIPSKRTISSCHSIQYLRLSKPLQWSLLTHSNGLSLQVHHSIRTLTSRVNNHEGTTVLEEFGNLGQISEVA